MASTNPALKGTHVIHAALSNALQRVDLFQNRFVHGDLLGKLGQLVSHL